MYGKNLRGPLDLLRADWEGTIQTSAVPVADFVYNLQMKLKAIQEAAKENLQQAQAKQIFYHDLKSKHREFKVGDSVLVLNPLWPHKLGRLGRPREGFAKSWNC